MLKGKQQLKPILCKTWGQYRNQTLFQFSASPSYIPGTTEYATFAHFIIKFMYPLLISMWLADGDRNRKLRLCPTDYRKVDLNIQGKWPVYFCFLNSFCMWFASKEQSRILIRYQYFFCNRKTQWQLPLYSGINLNVRIYHGKDDTSVSIEILSASFKIIISMRWSVILNAVNVLISSFTLGNHILV